ncbi:hypothetical protein IBX73_07210 [candidate division WOR-3 bacterium]|nr:hypothetical protein [candidate division WOR-3 bacterium]
MKRSLLFLLTVCTFALTNCNGAVLIEAPEMKTVIMGVTDITVFWELNGVIEGRADFAGYNVYAYTDSTALLVDDGEDLNKFNSQIITDTIYWIRGLSQDSIYYLQVRTVNTEDKVGGYHGTVPFLKGSPRPEFTVSLYLADTVQTVNHSCALVFAGGAIAADSAMLESGSDMWVLLAQDSVWFCAPSIHPLYGAGGRETMFGGIGSGEFDSVSTVMAEPGSTQIMVLSGDMVVARSQDGNYVKIRVESIDLPAGAITVRFAYQNIAGFPYF